MCGTSASLWCQLPTEDLDALVTITSDEDLANLIKEYDGVASPESSLKIQAFLLPKSTRKPPSPPSSASSSRSSTYSSRSSAFSSPRVSCICQISPRRAFPPCFDKSFGKVPHYGYHAHHRSSGQIYLVHNGNHWQ